ncbi:MAG: hypothetical protein Q7U00_08355 [Sulfurimonas sp.]|nr:hypothetical protein [Sulfurimonas sp.]
MKQDYLKDEGNALRVQQHQLNSTENKLSEISNILSGIKKEQAGSGALLDEMISNMESLLGHSTTVINNELLEENIVLIEKHLEVVVSNEDVVKVTELDKVEFDENMSWNEYLKSIEMYGFKHNLDLKDDPFKDLMTKSQQVELQKRIKDEFTFKNAQCDKYDYMIAGTCGVISGLIDILFVGAPGDSKFGDIADKQANKITEKFAEFLGWDKEKVVSKGNNTTASAIDFLEGNKQRSVTFNKDSWLYKQLQMIGLINEDGKFKGFKVNYDQTSLSDIAKEGKKLSTKNHHLKSLGHSPDIIGLIFSIFNQFTNTSSFIIEGKIITIDTDKSEINLQGHNFIAKIFCGFANWFGHVMSDWSGSNGTVGNGERGTGVPIPFYNLFQMIDIGSFKDTNSNGSKEKTFAEITEKVFKNSYDTRYGMAMAVPVLINELLIRFMYTMKSRFYHQKEWKECIPKGNIPEVRRMLLVGHGTLCIMDGTHAAVRSGGEMVQFLLRTNLIAWTRFGQLALKEVYAWHNSGHIDAEAVDEYIDNDLKRMLKAEIKKGKLSC